MIGLPSFLPSPSSAVITISDTKTFFLAGATAPAALLMIQKSGDRSEKVGQKDAPPPLFPSLLPLPFPPAISEMSFLRSAECKEVNDEK